MPFKAAPLLEPGTPLQPPFLTILFFVIKFNFNFHRHSLDCWTPLQFSFTSAVGLFQLSLRPSFPFYFSLADLTTNLSWSNVARVIRPQMYPWLT